MVRTDDPKVAFKDADVALLVGARPRGPGMERKDLLAANAQIFTAQGKALNEVAEPQREGAGGRQPGQHQRLHRDEDRRRICRAKNFTAMLRLDHNRALSQLAAKTGKPVGDIEKLAVWGNHSPTMYPDYRFATVDGKPLKDADQRRGLEPRHVHPDRRQARRGDHRGARPVVGGIGGQRRDRPHARLGARHATASG